MYSEVSLNLWIDETEAGDVYRLAAYGRDERGELDTSNWVSVEISKEDYECWTTDGDAWYAGNPYDGRQDKEFRNLLELFVIAQLQNEKEN